MSYNLANKSELLTLLQNPATGNSLVYEDGAMVDTITGEPFTIKNGIPVILNKDDVFGWNRKQQKGYDWFSLVYDLFFRFNVWNHRQWLSEIAETMEINPGDRVLETSVGTGQQFRNLKRHGADGHFFGNDISYGMLSKCQKNIRKWGIDIGLVQGNAEALPFHDHLFDVVFHIGGFNFFNDKKTAIDEMVRVAKPGAKLYIIDETPKFLERSAIASRFMPKPEPGVYDPPVELIPNDMLHISTRGLWSEQFWIVSFQKPEK